jgi:hypothetical protein
VGLSLQQKQQHVQVDGQMSAAASSGSLCFVKIHEMLLLRWLAAAPAV